MRSTQQSGQERVKVFIELIFRPRAMDMELGCRLIRA